MHYRHVLDNNIQNLVVPENNISTYGDRLGMMKMKTLLTHISLK